MKITKMQRKQIAVVFGVVCLLFFVMLGQDWMLGQSSIADGILRGQLESEVYQETYVLEQADGTKQDVDVVVYPRSLTSQEKQELLERAVAEFEQSYLGDNPSADQVSANLRFPYELCEGMVQAQYVTSHPEWIWEDGSVTTEDLPDEGVIVSLDVTFLCQDALLEYTCCVNVTRPLLTEGEQKRQRMEAAVAQAEEESRHEDRFWLPDKIDGQSVSWHKKFDGQSVMVLLLGVVAVIAILQKSKQDEAQKKQERERVLLREYPQMVSQLSLLMGAGMNVSVAWERMVKRYLTEQVGETDADRKPRISFGTIAPLKEKKLYLEEMLVTYREIQDGTGIRRAYENFGQRVGLGPYRKLIALLLQNQDKGNRDLVRLLDVEAELALEEQKNQVRRQGEEAGTKLLFPMLLLFVMVLIVIMIPAMQSF